MRQKILMIDGDVFLANQVRKLFAAAKLELEVVDNAVLGFVRLQQKHFDLVLLELDLPYQNGLVAIPRIKKLFPMLPVLIYTNSDFYRRSPVVWSTQAYLKKEDRLEPLLKKVLEFLPAFSSPFGISEQEKLELGPTWWD